MKKTNKGNRGGFGEFTPDGIAKKKIQDKRDEQIIKQADNKPKECGCCWYLGRLNVCELAYKDDHALMKIFYRELISCPIMDIAAPAPMYGSVDVEEMMPTAMNILYKWAQSLFKRKIRYLMFHQSLEWNSNIVYSFFDHEGSSDFNAWIMSLFWETKRKLAKKLKEESARRRATEFLTSRFPSINASMF